MLMVSDDKINILEINQTYGKTKILAHPIRIVKFIKTKNKAINDDNAIPK